MITLHERDSRAIQCATLSWLLVGDIREMLQDHLDEEALLWLRPILDALIEALREQAGLEELPGYYDDVLADFPHWSPIVDRIHAEQALLRQSLESLRHRIDCDLPFRRLATELEQELGDWVRLMNAHSKRERELMQNVYYTEIGGEG